MKNFEYKKNDEKRTEKYKNHDAKNFQINFYSSFILKYFKT